MSTRPYTVIAGSRHDFAWPVTVAAGGDVSTLDAVVLVTDTATDTTVEYETTITPGDTPNVGTIAASVEWADTVPRARFMVRLDVNDGAGDLAADQFDVTVIPASAQRPT